MIEARDPKPDRVSDPSARRAPARAGQPAWLGHRRCAWRHRGIHDRLGDSDPVRRSPQVHRRRLAAACGRARSPTTPRCRCVSRGRLSPWAFRPRISLGASWHWYRSRPPDIGNTCRRGIARFITHRTVHGPPNEGDAGNGAVMRMAPIALAALADEQLLEAQAIEQAHITHHHPLSDAACILVGRLIQLALIGHAMHSLRRQADAAARNSRNSATTPITRFRPPMWWTPCRQFSFPVRYFVFRGVSDCDRESRRAMPTPPAPSLAPSLVPTMASRPSRASGCASSIPRCAPRSQSLADQLIDHSPLAKGQPVSLGVPCEGKTLVPWATAGP